MIEAVAETDDALMEEFFEVGSLPDEDLKKGLRQAVLSRKLFPLTMRIMAGMLTIKRAIIEKNRMPAI